MNHTIHIALSGGIDSTAALNRAIRWNGPTGVRTYSFDYGQRHRRELESAERIARHYGITPNHTIVPMRGLLPKPSSLTGHGEVPDGHYAEPTMARTVVHGRNLLFASVVIAHADPGDQVWLGVHAGDHPIYPDCRPGFIEHLSEAANAYAVDVWAPWVHITKDAIIRSEPDAPYHLTWSCYKGGATHCGTCGTCVERREAFQLAGVTDPTEYATGDAA